MRLSDIEKGDGIANRLLIGAFSLASGMRLSDAERVAVYHKDFFSGPMGVWTQHTMRGPSMWSIGERELMAALVSKWSHCEFCVGAHSAIAARQLPPELVDAALRDYRSAGLHAGLTATLVFLEKMTRTPEDLTDVDVWSALTEGVSTEALEDAIAVATIFCIVARCANVLDYAVPTPEEFDRAADMLLKRGYQS
jgi:AhpD family alkylhydroperoxidase